MGFSIAIELEEAQQQQGQEKKVLGSSLNIMTSSCVKSTNSTTQIEPLPPPPHLHHQQPQHHFHHHQISDQQISFGMMPSSSSASIHGNYLSKDSGGYDFGELDQAFFLYLDGQGDPCSVQEQRQNSSLLGMRPPPTLNIFPSQPIHAVPPSYPKVNMELSATPTGSKKPPKSSMPKLNPLTEAPSAPQPSKTVKPEANRKGTTSSSEQEAPKTPDPKTLRRLAQNREAARKSRLRKKAYVQQLESSRIKLNQLEQELQRVRAHGILMGGTALMGREQGFPMTMNGISSEGAMFDMEYARWLEEQERIVCELRGAVEEEVNEKELGLYVGNWLAHYDKVMKLKSILLKTDVFHLVFGLWKTPPERCFMWIGGFRPSQLIQMTQLGVAYCEKTMDAMLAAYYQTHLALSPKGAILDRSLIIDSTVATPEIGGT